MTSFRKWHILKPENSSTNQDSNPHPLARKADMLTITLSIIPAPLIIPLCTHLWRCATDLHFTKQITKLSLCTHLWRWATDLHLTKHIIKTLSVHSSIQMCNRSTLDKADHQNSLCALICAHVQQIYTWQSRSSNSLCALICAHVQQIYTWQSRSSNSLCALICAHVQQIYTWQSRSSKPSLCTHMCTCATDLHLTKQIIKLTLCTHMCRCATDLHLTKQIIKLSGLSFHTIDGSKTER